MHLIDLFDALGKPVRRRTAVVAAGAPFAALLPATRTSDPARATDDADTALALSELQGQLARTQSACLRVAQQLEARHVRYAWTEQLARELRAIAHDTVGG